MLDMFIVIVALFYIDGLVQERRNSIAKALELRLSCTNPSMWYGAKHIGDMIYNMLFQTWMFYADM